MPIPMFDLVAKSQGKKTTGEIYPNKNGLYLYKNEFKTLEELAEIGGILSVTLQSRFTKNKYASIEEAVHAPVKRKQERSKRRCL